MADLGRVEVCETLGSNKEQPLLLVLVAVMVAPRASSAHAKNSAIAIVAGLIWRVIAGFITVASLFLLVCN